MQKILFIIQSYPSFRSANVLCDEKIVRVFSITEKCEMYYLPYHQIFFKNTNGIQANRLYDNVVNRVYQFFNGGGNGGQ